MADEHVSEHDPVAFAAKLKAWREEGCNIFSFSFAGGNRRDFHELPSVAQRERDHVRELTEAGIDFDRPSR